MKAVDTYSIKHIGIPSLVLMECAALKVAAHVRTETKQNTRFIAVSGTGNNGADAVATVRILHNAGFETGVIFVGNQDHASEELIKQKEIIRNLNIPEYNISNSLLTENDWLLDGIFGIGLTRPIEGAYAQAIAWMNESPARVCAVDIPSGIFADNGQVLGCAVHADMTVSFGYMKKGLMLYPGASYAGTVYIEDIGFARGALAAVAPKTAMLEPSDIQTLLPERRPDSNKGTYGKLLVIAGAVNTCGAAVFAGKSAYQTGVGLVKIMTPEENRVIIGQSVPEAILETYPVNTNTDDSKFYQTLKSLGEKVDISKIPGMGKKRSENKEGIFNQKNDIYIEKIREQTAWADAIVFGPGMGKMPHVHRMLEFLLKEQTKPVVIDADGLNVLSEHLDWLEKHSCPIVITPHLGEMARLTGQSIPEIKAHLQETCESFAKKYQVTCVLKDARTMISDGKTLTWINTSGNAGMSTGGSGDVLSGIIGGLVCQMQLINFENIKPKQDNVDVKDSEALLTITAALGVYIHGLAGDEAKKVCGTYGLLASDIIKYMKYVLKEVKN